MPADPYAAQLTAFKASTPNARRGLIDLYKLRRRNIEGHYNEMGTLYGSAYNKSAASNAASQKALGGFVDQNMGQVALSGYDVGGSEAKAAVRGMLTEGSAPYGKFMASEGKAQGSLFKALKGAEQYEDKTLKTGLAREQPAALSELEQGIIDTSTNLAAQSGAFQAQNQLQAQQQQYMNQMLQYQGQIAGGMAQGIQGANAGGGLSSAEQWIIGKESGAQGVHADNPTSTAFGLGQLLLSNRQTYGRQLGFNPNTTDYGEQLQMMRSYISDRYGSAEAAMRFWQQNGWY